MKDEVKRLTEQAAAEAEARRRTAGANALTTGAAALLALGPWLHGGLRPVGEQPVAARLFILGGAWVAFELAAICFHSRGYKHALSRATSAFDEAAQYSALLALIFFSGSALSPLWLITLIKTFAWKVKTPARARFDVAVLGVAHGGLALAFLARGQTGDTLFSMLMLGTSIIGHRITAGWSARTLQLRAEREVIERHLELLELNRDRERIAREIHDGVAADVMALLLRLRRLSEGKPDATRLADQAQDILDELRGVVWSLRNEQGTLAELCKLIDARCRGLCRGVIYERSSPPEHATRLVRPEVALTVLNAVQELVRLSAARPGVTRVSLHLGFSREPALVLTVEDDGASRLPNGGESDLAPANRLIEDANGQLTCSTRAESRGRRLQATVPLEARAWAAG